MSQKNNVSISFSSRNIIKSLKKLGITPRKSLTFSPSEECLYNKHFWRGMIDGDGGIYVKGEKKYKTNEIKLCGSLDSVKAFNEFIYSICGKRYKVAKCGKIYSTSAFGDNALIVIKELYDCDAVYYLDRKYNSAIRAIKTKEHVPPVLG